MRKTFKWAGFALVALGVAVFPFAIWFEGPWAVLSLLMIMAGCFLLVLALRGAGLEMREEPAGDVADDGHGKPGQVEQGSSGGDKPSA